MGIPVIPRGEMLAELMRLKFGIAVAGSHGKTSTTSMVASLMNQAALDATVVVGGRVGIMGGSNARVGKSDFLVVESDESDGSFLKLAPIIAVVTNIDREHLDHYATLEDILKAFLDFVNKVPFYGAAILCLDNENVQKILPLVTRRTITYGSSPQADLVVCDQACSHLESHFRLKFHDQDLGEFQISVPGFHNVLNATAAVAIGLELEVPIETIRLGLANYTGVDRRFQIRGQARGITVVDDYGHHPTEVRATLDAARLCRYPRIHVIFQPHRYSRTKFLMEEFGRAFHQADSVHVLDIYAASEQAIDGVSGEALAEKIRAYGHRSANYAGTVERAIDAVLAEAKDGDLILTLGAGSVWQAGDKILERLREE
jgi:UDP-N-acetylmuramate--alanine ligase